MVVLPMVVPQSVWGPAGFLELIALPAYRVCATLRPSLMARYLLLMDANRQIPPVAVAILEADLEYPSIPWGLRANSKGMRKATSLFFEHL